MTSAEIRSALVETVAKRGGHLASSLGAVEIAVALAKKFDPAKDRVFWDVGHQAYAWKMLTGRAGRMATLRGFGGISGFPLPAESPCDAAVAGHAGVALSNALGFAAARDARGGAEHVVAVVGDASLSNGVALEALDSGLAAKHKVILVVNDNSTGDAASGLAYGDALGRCGFGATVRVDGNDLRALAKAFSAAKAAGTSVAVIAKTKKGLGFAPAEADPAAWHAVGGFDAESPAAPSCAGTWSAEFGEAMCALAERDGRVVALTAAMKEGTGLAEFAERFPDRFFDAGIREEHAVSFAAGLAAGGLKPYVAVYSTFLQRAVDQVMHDVCISSLPVVFCIDRAGVVGADGATHQGIYDIAMLRCLPNLEIWQPCDAKELAGMLAAASRRKGPVAIRYPRGAAPQSMDGEESAPAPCRLAIWTTCDWLAKAHEVAALAGGAEVVPVRRIKPFDAKLLARQRAAGMTVVSLENAAVAGGIGEMIGADIRFGWPDSFVPHGAVEDLERAFGLDAASVAAKIRRRLRTAAKGGVRKRKGGGNG